MFKFIVLLVAAMVVAMVSATGIPRACRTKPSMSMYSCNILKTRWGSGKCDAYKVHNPTAPYVVWVGKGCPTPCAQKAQSLHQNPRAYCRANGNKSPSFGDGGCKLGSDCHIFCEDTCKNQPHCVWAGSACTYEYEAVGRRR